MGEIKFRAWDKVNKEMVGITGLHFWYAGNLSTVSFDGTEGEKQDIDVKRFEIMQYTGLLDKNGKEIYEGDIVMANTPYCTKDPKEIVWDDKRAGFFMKADFVAYDPKNLYKLSGFKMEVIGNIHENPELLTPTEQ